MDLIEAKILLKNLIKRIETTADGNKQLPGVLTDDEIEALQISLNLFSNSPSISPVVPQIIHPIPPIPFFTNNTLDATDENDLNESRQAEIEPHIELDLSALSSSPPPENVRLCLDFGTAMSKATLVHDDEDIESEEIHVLRLGVPGDQEEISEHMLISSVYIDNAGLLWFGKAAVDRSKTEGSDGSRLRLDNIKRRLSEDGWDELVGLRFNPTEINITHGDMVLAYLMYMTWAINSCLEELGYPWNLPRRFAMPCLSGEKGRETVHRLRKLIGEAQVLADTFYSKLKNGIPLGDFVAAVNELRKEPRSYPYVGRDITEPLGVVGSIISWKKSEDRLIMVVDVGAGTSDLSLYRVHYDPAGGQNTAIEIKNTSRVLTEAGNHLDKILIELIIKKSGITSEDPMWINVRSALELEIRDLKETLFNDGFVFVLLMNGSEVNIELDEFLQIESVRKFGESLQSTMVDILESIDNSWVTWVLKNPNRKLIIALTGGGAQLPMVKKLAEGEIKVNGLNVPVAAALRFPLWLKEIDENLEEEYPRIAVSLGGARRRLFEPSSANITAGDVTETPRLGGYYTKGS